MKSSSLTTSPIGIGVFTSVFCIFLIGCIQQGELPPKPEAKISSTTTSINVGGTVAFKDISIGNPTARLWEFEGGDPGTAIVDSITVRYNQAGTFTTKLTVENEAGSSNKTIEVIVKNTPIPVAKISASRTTIKTGESISFSDVSSNTPTSRNWTFPSGSPASSTNRDVTVTWSTPGKYVVKLISRNAGGTGEATVEITVTSSVVKPDAAISASTTSIRTGQTVTFTDVSTNSPTSRSWSFPGGSPSSSTSASVTVTYNSVGNYTATLQVSNSAGSDSESMVISVTSSTSNTIDGTNFSASKTTPSELITLMQGGYTDFVRMTYNSGTLHYLVAGSGRWKTFTYNEQFTDLDQFINKQGYSLDPASWIGPSAEWLVVYGGNGYSRRNIPSNVISKLLEFNQLGQKFTRFDRDSDGNYTIITASGTWGNWSTSGIASILNGNAIVSFAYGSSNSWAAVSRYNYWTSSNAPSELKQKLLELKNRGAQFVDIEMEGTTWIILYR